MKTMLVLNIPPELEGDLVDYLLGLDYLYGFTSYQARGHGHHQGMNIAEQVSGRRKRLQFEMMLEVDDLEKVVAGLKEQVGTDIVWWEQMLGRFGEL